MANPEIQFIPDRLNEEPVVYIGMTNSELKLAALLSVGVWVPVCVLLGALLGWGVLGLAIGMALAFASMWAGGKKMRSIKRGKPKQYHVTLLTAWLEDRGLKRKTMIRSSEVWDIRRSGPR